MFDDVAQDIALKAKARTGLSQELVVWLAFTLFLTAGGIVFFSIAAFFWLTLYLSEAAAAAIVGGANVLIAAAALARCSLLRRRNAALALAKLKEAERRTPWWSDPVVVTMGYEIAKTIGLRKLTPLVAAGVLAATTFGRRGGKRRTANGSQPHHAAD